MRELLAYTCRKCGKITSTTNQVVFEGKMCFACRSKISVNEVVL